MLWVLFEKSVPSGSYENVAFTTISNFKPSCTRLKESWSELRLLKAFLLIKYKKKPSILLLFCLIQCMTQSIGLFPQVYHQYIWWWFMFFYWFQQIKFNKRKLWFQLDEMRLRWSMADSIYRLIYWYIVGGLKISAGLITLHLVQKLLPLIFSLPKCLKRILYFPRNRFWLLI